MLLKVQAEVHDGPRRCVHYIGNDSEINSLTSVITLGEERKSAHLGSLRPSLSERQRVCVCVCLP